MQYILKSKKQILILAFILLFYIIIGFINKFNIVFQADEYRVKKVIDGDTILVLKDGIEYSVRYLEINTPEIDHPEYEKYTDECYGKEAFEFNKLLVSNKVVRLVKDKTDKDKYGRLLRYVFFEDKFINNILVQRGYAKSEIIPPNYKYKELILKSEDEAINQKVGLWSSCFDY